MEGKWKRLPWVAGIAGPLAFVVSWVAAGRLRAGYDPATEAISRLAALGTANRWIVTVGIVCFGIGAVVFGYGLRRVLWPPVGSVLMVAGAAAWGVAAFPCTEGCPGSGTFTDEAHGIAAGIHYVAFAAAPLIAGMWAGRRDRRAFRVFSVGAGIVGGAALVMHVTGAGPNGLMQRTGLTILDLWMIGTAALVASSEGWNL